MDAAKAAGADIKLSPETRSFRDFLVSTEEAVATSRITRIKLPCPYQSTENPSR